MPTIDLSILNQRQTPAFYADVFANRPAAGYIGRIFVSTDTFAFYRDNGTGWDLIGGPGTGTITGTGASGQIALWDGASTITGDTGLTYDGTDNSLTASKFIVTGGTSSQFLKADGSVDSSSYVPYTGATASLDMGANNILGQNFFVRGDNSTSGGFLGFRQFSGSSSGTTGYTSISALQQNSLYFQYSQTDGSNKVVELSTALLGTTPRQFLFPNADGTFALTSNLTAYVPYTGATANVNLGINDITAGSFTGGTGSFDTSGSGNTVGINHSSGSGIGLNINKSGSGEGLFITKGSGGGNAATINGGLVRIENNSGDAQLQIVSSSAPSVRIDNAATGATKRAGLGISTATNNFIQGSADQDFCIFNSSTTASPILFGVYDAGLGNTQEAARISPARNFLVGSVTDSGEKLQVNGTSIFSSSLTLTAAASSLFMSLRGRSADDYGFIGFYNNTGATRYGYIQSHSSNGGQLNITMDGGAQIIGDNRGLLLQPTSGNVGIGVTPSSWSSNYVALQFGAKGALWSNRSSSDWYLGNNELYNSSNQLVYLSNGRASEYFQFDGKHVWEVAPTGTAGNIITYNTAMVLTNNSNLLIGTTTDAGQKLQVNGTVLATKFQGAVNTISNSTNTFGSEVAGANLYFSGNLASGQQFGSTGGTYVLGLYFIFYIDSVTNLRGSAIFMAGNPVANGGFNLVTQSGALTFSNVYNAVASISLANNASNRGPILTNNTTNTLTFSCYVFGGI